MTATDMQSSSLWILTRQWIKIGPIYLRVLLGAATVAFQRAMILAQLNVGLYIHGPESAGFCCTVVRVAGGRANHT